MASYHHRLHQGTGSQQLHYALHVIREHMQAHFSTGSIECLCQEMRRPHPRLERPIRVLHCPLPRTRIISGV
jgi:hypothetical protein